MSMFFLVILTLVLVLAANMTVVLLARHQRRLLGPPFPVHHEFWQELRFKKVS